MACSENYDVILTNLKWSKDQYHRFWDTVNNLLFVVTLFHDFTSNKLVHDDLFSWQSFIQTNSHMTKTGSQWEIFANTNYSEIFCIKKVGSEICKKEL